MDTVEKGIEHVLKLLRLFRTEQEPEVVLDERTGRVVAIRITIPISQDEAGDEDIDLGSAV